MFGNTALHYRSGCRGLGRFGILSIRNRFPRNLVPSSLLLSPLPIPRLLLKPLLLVGLLLLPPPGVLPMLILLSLSLASFLSRSFSLASCFFLRLASSLCSSSSSR